MTSAREEAETMSNVGWRGISSRAASFPYDYDKDPRRFAAAETRVLVSEALADRDSVEHD